MFAAFKRQAQAQPEAVDLSAGIARALRRPATREGVQDDTGTLKAIRDVLVVLDGALGLLEEAAAAVRDCAGYVIEAASENDPAERALLAERYDDARERLDALQPGEEDSAHRLLGQGAVKMSVALGGADYAVAPFPMTTGEAGLDLPPPAEAFATHTEIADTLRRVETALERVARAAEVYRCDAGFLRGKERGPAR